MPRTRLFIQFQILVLEGLIGAWDWFTWAFIKNSVRAHWNYFYWLSYLLYWTFSQQRRSLVTAFLIQVFLQLLNKRKSIQLSLFENLRKLGYMSMRILFLHSLINTFKIESLARLFPDSVNVLVHIITVINFPPSS